MYRSEREALIARLAQLTDEQEERSAEEDSLQRDAERRSELRERIRRLRRQPYLLALVAGLFIFAYAVVAGVQDTPEAEAREQRRAELEAELEAAEADLEGARRFARQQLERYEQPPEISPELSTLYGELRYLDGTDETDAWLIVGAVSCAGADTTTEARVREALSEESLSELDALCAPWSAP